MVAKREETKFFELFVLSGVATGVSKTVAAPLERVKLLVQSQDEMMKQVFNMQELQKFQLWKQLLRRSVFFWQ